MPIQSTNLPLISLYYLMNTFYTLIGLLWFVILNHFRTKKYCPNIFKKILGSFLKKDFNISETDETEKYNEILNLIVFSLLFIFMFFTYLIIMVLIYL